MGITAAAKIGGLTFRIIKGNPLIMVAVSPMTGQLIIPYFISHIFIFKGELAITLYFAPLKRIPEARLISSASIFTSQSVT